MPATISISINSLTRSRSYEDVAKSTAILTRYALANGAEPDDTNGAKLDVVLAALVAHIQKVAHAYDYTQRKQAFAATLDQLEADNRL